jgi:uncharacterized damage-inducible protein DinB
MHMSKPLPSRPEVWQRGPVASIPALLQPVAHALLQANEELISLMQDFPETLLWEKPAGVASPGFHLQHLSGVLDRLFTYARGEMLTPEQRKDLAQEGQAIVPELSVGILIQRFQQQVNISLEQLRNTNEQTLTDFRGLGAKQIPTTVLGLLFHSAEHTMRHIGQLLVTVKVLMDKKNTL